MRDLRRAAQTRDPKKVFASISHLPHRHPGPFAGCLIGFLVALVLAGAIVDTKNDVQVLQPQVTQIVEATAACQPPVPKTRLESCATRIESALKVCRQTPSCRAAFAAVLLAPKPPRKGVVPHQPSNSAPQQPGPSGGQPGSVGGKGKQPSVTPPASGVKPETPPNSSQGQSNPPAPAEPSRGPLAPVLTPITPPAAAPAIEHACQKAAAVAAVC